MPGLKKFTLFSTLFVLLAAAALLWPRAQATAGPAVAQGGGFLNYVPLASAQGIPINCLFMEEDGMLVFEVESAPIVDPFWVLEKDVPGYLGKGYYTWRGPEYFGQPGVAIMTYPILINTPGDYVLRIRNFHDHPANDQQNDVWIRLDNGPWIKAFSSVSFEWTWLTAYDLEGGPQDAVFENLQPGGHIFEMSARSHGFRMDRVAIYQSGLPGEDPAKPQSPCVIP